MPLLTYPVPSPLYGSNYPYVQASQPAQSPVDPFLLPHSAFDSTIDNLGCRFLWQKSHACPCLWYPTDTAPRGTAKPDCQTCSGLGWYWDAPVGPVVCLFTYAHSPLAVDEPGTPLDQKIGQILGGFPQISVCHDINYNVWNEASEMDKFTEIGAELRFNAHLDSQQNTTLPYSVNLAVSTTGAVTTWSTATSSVISVSGYTISGSQVLIPDSYPAGTPYIVEFFANPVYLLFRRAGGMSHVRSFAGSGVPDNPLPRRFRAAPLDLYLRERNSF